MIVMNNFNMKQISIARLTQNNPEKVLDWTGKVFNN